MKDEIGTVYTKYHNKDQVPRNKNNQKQADVADPIATD